MDYNVDNYRRHTKMCKTEQTRFWVHWHLNTHLRASECETEINRRKEAKIEGEIYSGAIKRRQIRMERLISKARIY